jgi:hypothetical protein
MQISKHRSNLDHLKHLIFWRTVSYSSFWSIVISNMLFVPALSESDPTCGRLSGYPSTFCISCLLLCPNDRSTSLPRFPFVLSHCAICGSGILSLDFVAAGRCRSEGSVISSCHHASTRNYSIAAHTPQAINQPSEISFHAALAPSPSTTTEACGGGSSPPTDQALSLSGLYLLQAPAFAQVALVPATSPCLIGAKL